MDVEKPIRELKGEKQADKLVEEPPREQEKAPTTMKGTKKSRLPKEQRALKVEEEHQDKERQANQMWLALKMANKRRDAVEEKVKQILVDPVPAR